MNGQVAVMDLATGKPVRPALSVYSGDTFSVRYNESGSLVTTASTAGQLALLDGRTGEVLATTSLPPARSAAMSGFAPDGTIVVADFVGHVFRWDPSVGKAIRFACSITGGGLPPAQWAEDFPGRPWQQACPS